MAFEQDEQLLSEYVQWSVVQKGDKSPTAFLVHRAQQSAFDKLTDVEDYAQGLVESDVYTENIIGAYLLELIE